MSHLTTFDIIFGRTYEDEVTGFTGIATSLTTYWHDAPAVGLKPAALDKDGKPQEVQYFVPQRLQFADTAV